MKIIKEAEEMRNYSARLKREGSTLAFVPTMGFLHEGHISLLREAKKHGDKIVLSIFVNPTQFGANEDLDKYPSNLENDFRLAEAVGTDVIFLPEKEKLYGENYQTYVYLEDLPGHLCGISRPVHFKGVATIVTKLFNIVMPDAAVFGTKDFQQLAVIRQMTKDLSFGIKIIGAPIVREDDGLAMSSRNTYLTEEQRKTALVLYKSLQMAEDAVKKGENNPRIIIEMCEKYINSFDETTIDYLSVCDPDTLDEVTVINKPVLFALAVIVGSTRLIDNGILMK